MLEINPYLNKSGYQLKGSPKLFVHEDKNANSIKLGRSYVYQTKSSLGSRIRAILLAIVSFGLSLISKSCRNAFLGRKFVEVKVAVGKKEYEDALKSVSQEELKKIAFCYLKHISLSKKEEERQEFIDNGINSINENMDEPDFVKDFSRDLVLVSFPKSAADFEELQRKNEALIQPLRDQGNRDAEALVARLDQMSSKELRRLVIALEMEKSFNLKKSPEDLENLLTHLKNNVLREFTNKVREKCIRRVLYQLNPEQISPFEEAVRARCEELGLKSHLMMDVNLIIHEFEWVREIFKRMNPESLQNCDSWDVRKRDTFTTQITDAFEVIADDVPSYLTRALEPVDRAQV